MWNNVFQPITSDDYDLRFFDCDTAHGTTGASQKGQVVYFQVGHYMGYDLVGRTEVEPLPVDPDFKLTGRLWVFGLYPLLAPQEIHGTGFIRWRYADPNRPDDDWSLGSGSRRVRRLNESIMSDQTGAQEWNPDHYSRLQRLKTEFYDYKFLGEKNMHSPALMPPIRRKCDAPPTVAPALAPKSGRCVTCTSSRRSRVAASGRRLGFWIQKPSSTWTAKCGLSPTSTNTTSRVGSGLTTSGGQLIATGRFRTPRSLFIPSSGPLKLARFRPMFQSGLATMCYLPGMETPERECWYINMGAVDRSNFTTDAMVRAAAF